MIKVILILSTLFIIGVITTYFSFLFFVALQDFIKMLFRHD